MNLENFQYAKTKITALRLLDIASPEQLDILRHFRAHNYYNNPVKLANNPTIVKDSILVSSIILKL